MRTRSSSSFRVAVDRLLLLVQGRGLVHRFAAGLLAAYQVLRLLLRRLHRASGRLGLTGDLLLHRALGLRAVGVPRHLVALLELLLAHGASLLFVDPPGPSGPAVVQRAVRPKGAPAIPSDAANGPVNRI